MRPIFLQDPLDEKLRQRGWIQTPLLNGPEVAELLGKIRDLRPTDNFSPSGNNPNQPSYHCTFLDPSREYRRASDQLIRSFFNPRLEGLLSNYRILTSNIHVKPPGQGALMIHQNWPTTANLADTTVTVWCPLVDVSQNNGTVQVIDGSHKILPEVANFACEPYYKSFEEALKKSYFVPLDLSAGEALVFDDSLLHYSTRNSTEQPRIAIQMVMVPREVPTVLYWLEPERPNQFELLAADSEFFIEAGATLFLGRPNLPSLGFVENHNRPITEREFTNLLQQGEQIRRSLYPG